ncbi:MAG: MFS transporter [Candidatus Margulisiibacteriota bacterium]
MEEYILTDKFKQFWLIAIICSVAFMIQLDFTSLNISLAALAKFFGVKVGMVAWLPTIYLLIITSMLLGFGKLGDIIGYQKVFLAGLVVFCLGAIACSVAPNFIALFLARAFQSLGLAMFSPICIAFLTYYLPANVRGRALGLYATALGLGMTTGPALGGLITSCLSWRGNFILGAVISLIIFIAGLILLPSKQEKASDSRFDYLGALLLFIGMVGFLFALNTVAKAGWSHPKVLTGLILSPLAFVFFILREKKVAYPLLDLTLFGNLNFTFAALAALFGLAMNIGMGFLFPFYLQMMIHLSVIQMGFLLMCSPIMLMLLSPITGSLSDYLGSRRLCMTGMGLAACAFLLFTFLTPQSSQWQIVLGLICMGTGMGFFIAPNNRLMMQNAPVDKQGVASGVYKIALNAGSSIGIASYMLVMSYVVIFDVSKMNIMLGSVRQHPEILLSGFRGAFIFGMVMALITFFFSFLAKDKK